MRQPRYLAAIETDAQQQGTAAKKESKNMKFWISSAKIAPDESYTYCDSLLSAYRYFINHKKELTLKMRSKNFVIYCDPEYKQVITTYFAKQFTFSPIPKIVAIEELQDSES